MTDLIAANHLADLQHEIQRLIGQNVLRLQLYEQQLKLVLASADFGVELLASGEYRQTQGIVTEGKTLGHLVRQLFGEVMVSGSIPRAPDRVEAAFPDTEASFHMKLQFGALLGKHDELVAALSELVRLRNTLVHSFIVGHDLLTVEGCQTAITDLRETLDIVGQQVEQLQSLALQIDALRQQAHAFLTLPAIEDHLVKGIIAWEFTDIVAELRAAAQELAEKGWTPVNNAADWIKARNPDQGPQPYKCTSWRHLIHESGCFDLQYHTVDGRRIAMYRERVRPVSH